MTGIRHSLTRATSPGSAVSCKWMATRPIPTWSRHGTKPAAMKQSGSPGAGLTCGANSTTCTSAGSRRAATGSITAMTELWKVETRFVARMLEAAPRCVRKSPWPLSRAPSIYGKRNWARSRGNPKPPCGADLPSGPWLADRRFICRATCSFSLSCSTRGVPNVRLSPLGNRERARRLLAALPQNSVGRWDRRDVVTQSEWSRELRAESKFACSYSASPIGGHRHEQQMRQCEAWSIDRVMRHDIHFLPAHSPRYSRASTRT